MALSLALRPLFLSSCRESDRNSSIAAALDGLPPYIVSPWFANSVYRREYRTERRSASFSQFQHWCYHLWMVPPRCRTTSDIAQETRTQFNVVSIGRPWLARPEYYKKNNVVIEDDFQAHRAVVKHSLTSSVSVTSVALPRTISPANTKHVKKNYIHISLLIAFTANCFHC